MADTDSIDHTECQPLGNAGGEFVADWFKRPGESELHRHDAPTVADTDSTAPKPCGWCGKDPARGFASMTAGDHGGEVWLCHDGDSPTCYEIVQHNRIAALADEVHGHGGDTVPKEIERLRDIITQIADALSGRVDRG